VTEERPVATLDELPPGTVRSVDVDGRRVCLANHDGEVFALDDRCLHKGGSLGKGRLDAGLVTCPLHWWRYDVRTGALSGRPVEAVQTFPVRVEHGRVLVSLPPAAPALPWREVLRRHACSGTPGPHAGSAPRRPGRDQRPEQHPDDQHPDNQHPDNQHPGEQHDGDRDAS
jgi:nitrite reductase/ring-hydroxylating ferredoxin subunit